MLGEGLEVEVLLSSRPEGETSRHYEIHAHAGELAVQGADPLLVVRDPGKEGQGQGAHRAAGFLERPHGRQARCWGRGAGLEDGAHVVLESGDRNQQDEQGFRVQPLPIRQIAQDQVRFRHDGDRHAGLRKEFRTPADDALVRLDRLVGVGRARAYRDHTGLPEFRKLHGQPVRKPVPHLEVLLEVSLHIVLLRPSIAVAAAVGAALVGGESV